MVLSSRGSGKYLSGKYARDRNKAMRDKTGFDADELEYLEITGTDGTAVHQDRTYEIDTEPVDFNTPRRTEKVDIRKRPECGDSDIL